MIAGQLEILMLTNLAKVQSDMEQMKSAVTNSMQSIEQAIGLATKALIGFAGVASINAFAGMIEGNIQAAAALGKLATQAGTTVEALSGLASVGKLSGTSADAIATAMNKMTKAVAGTAEDAKGAGAAIAALGMNFDDFNKMSADERMVAVAQAMDKFQDGTGKSAAAMALMGKAGAEMLPYMKDLAIAGELHAKITTAQAAAARDFENNLKRVTATSDAWKKELSMGMLPALDEASKAYLAVMNGAGGFRDEITKLSRDGSIADWTRMAINALSYLMDALEGTLRIAKAIGLGMAAQWAAMAQVAQGNFSAAGTVIKEAWNDIGNLFSAQSLGSKFRDRMEELKNVKAAAEAAKPALDDSFMRKAAKGATTTDADLASMQALNNAEIDHIAILQKQATQMDALTHSEQLMEKLKTTSIEGYSKEALAARASYEAKLLEGIAIEKAAAARDADTAALKKYEAATQSNIVKLQEEAEAMNLTPLALKQITAARMIDKAASDAIFKTKTDEFGITQQILAVTPDLAAKILIKAEADKAETKALIDKIEAQKLNIQYQQEIAKLTEGNGLYFDAAERAVAQLDLEAAKRLKAIDALHLESDARKQLLDDYNQWYQLSIDKIGADKLNAVWQSVDSTAHTTFTNIFEGGQDAFTKLRDTLKSTLLDLLYQMTVKKWVFEIFADVTGSGSGGSGVASAVTGGQGGLMGLINTGKNANSVYNYANKAYDWMFGGPGSASGTGGQASVYSNSGYTGDLGGGYAGPGEATTNTTLYSDLGYTGGETASGAATVGEGATAVEAGAASTGPIGIIAAAIIAVLASRDATSVQSTGDSRTKFNADGTIADRANAMYGGDTPIIIPSVVNGQAVTGPAYHTFSPGGAYQGDGSDPTTYDATIAANNAKTDDHLTAINTKADAYLKSVNDAYLVAAKNLGVGSVATTMGYGSNDSDGGKFRLSTSTANSSFDSGEIKADDGALSLAANRAILTALEGSDLPKWMQGVFDNVDASKLDQKGIDAAIQSAVDLKTAYTTLGSIKGVNLTGISFETLNDLKATASQLALVDHAFDTLGYALLDVSKTGGDAAASLVAAFGTVQQFQTAMSTYFQNYRTSAQQQDMTYQGIQSDLAKVGLNYTTAQLVGATRADIAKAVDAAFASTGTTDTQKAALITAANTLAPLKAALDAVTPSVQAATTAIGGSGGGGGGGGGGNSLVSAFQSLTDAIYKEVERIRGLVAGPNALGLAGAQSTFAIATAQARAGDQTAAGALPGLSQAMLTLAEANAHSLTELNMIRAQTAASLQMTGNILAAQYGLTIPSFDVGTNLIPHDMIARVHAGEAIVPAAYNPANGGGGGGGDSGYQVVMDMFGKKLDKLDHDVDEVRKQGKRTADVVEKWDGTIINTSAGVTYMQTRAV